MPPDWPVTLTGAEAGAKPGQGEAPEAEGRIPADRAARVQEAADKITRGEPPQAEVERVKLRIAATRQAERELYRAEHAYRPADPVTLADLLAEPDDAESWRVESILPAGSIAVLAAEAKAGKSTLVLNLIRSLLRREPFLGYRTYRPDGPIWYVNTDRLRRNLFRTWSRKIIGPTGEVAFWDVPNPTHLDILDPENRAAFAADLRAHGVGFLIIDSALPLLAALGQDENDNSAVRAWLDAWRPLQDASGVGEVLIVHHTGHLAKDRSRGASAWADGIDVMWTLLKDDDDQTREFRCPFGRGIVPARVALSFDADSLRIGPAGEPLTKAQRSRNALAGTVLQVLEQHDGMMTASALVEAARHGHRTVMAAVAMLETLGQVSVTPDPRDKRNKLIALIQGGPDLLASLGDAA